MDYYCDVCDKTKKIKSNNKHLQNLPHIEPDKCMKTKHSNKKTDFFDINEVFSDYITNHKKINDLHLVIYDFNLFCDKDFYPHIESDLQYNTTIFHFKRRFSHWIE